MAASRRAAVDCSNSRTMRRYVAIGLVVAVVALFAAIRIWDSTTDNSKRVIEADVQPSSQEFSVLNADIRTDSITELIVELGEVPYGTTATQHISLTNTTDKPLSLINYQATCRCTWIELPRYPIAPDESAELELVFDSRGEFGSVGNYIEVETSNEECIIAVWMSAEVIN